MIKPMPPSTPSASPSVAATPIPIAGPNASPSTAITRAPSANPQGPIALVLPTRSTDFARAAEAVRAGVTAARDALSPQRELRVFESDGSRPSTLEAYRAANTANAAAIIGPLTRSEVQWVGAELKPTVPTIALNTFDGVPPNNFYTLSLAVDNEARQIALVAYEEARANDPAQTPTALVVTTASPLHKRAAQNFAEAFSAAGGRVLEMLEAPSEGPIVVAPRIQSAQPSLVFVALPPARAGALNAALRTVPMYGTSSLNAVGERLAMIDLEGVRLVDAPWLLVHNDSELARFARPDVQVRYTPEIERLYALGVDALRLALELSAGRNAIELSGATGTLSVMGPRVERRARTATVRNGEAVPDERP
ncbi:MAG TPA: penicillin-binding protein activator [Burkholderiaceae bacterium]|nr:penicillin-binding protein activator [Burkholderiaceae bacterium]